MTFKMAAPMNKEICQVLPNFRRVYPRSNSNDEGDFVEGMLFRCSTPDQLPQKHADMIVNSGIKTIIDLRPAKEYLRTPGDKFLDKFYSIYTVKDPYHMIKLQYEVKEPVQLRKLKSRKHEVRKEDMGLRRICLDFFRMNYVISMLISAPLYLILKSVIFLIKDLFDIRAKYYKRFVSFFAENFFNVHGLLAQYKNMIDWSQASICTALKILAEPGSLPAIIHCVHGKDRTGILTAIILSVMGVPRDEIVQDYALSAGELECVKERVHYEICVRYNMAEEFKTSKPELMRALLEHIDQKYGSVEGYLDHIGFGPEERQRLRDNLRSTS